MGVEVCSICTVGTPYKGKGLSARANRIGKCFFMKKYQSILKAKLPTLQEVPKNRQTFGHSVLTARATGAQRLVC